MSIKPVLIYIMAFSSAFSLGCKERKTLNFNPGIAKSKLSAENTLASAKILQAYYHLKDALVDTDSKRAATATEEITLALVSFKDKLAKSLKDSTVTAEKTANLNRLLTDMTNQAAHIRSVNEPDCERMRIYFKALSDDIYVFLKETGMENIKAYHHYCPMAMNERGAYWLSSSPDIENPYFGQKMLTCGELVDTIR